MAQITIYLDDQTSTLLKSATKDTGVSQSQWIAEAVRLRMKREWPNSVRAMAGTWPDFPEVEAIRNYDARDLSREKL